MDDTSSEFHGDIVLELKGDQKVISQLQLVRAEQNKSVQGMREAQRTSSTLNTLAQQLTKSLSSAFEAGTKGATYLADKVKSVVGELKEMQTQAKRTEDAAGHVPAKKNDDVRGKNPNLGSAFSAVQRFAGSAGLGGVAEISGLVDDTLGLKDALKELGGAVVPLGAAALVAAPALIAAGIQIKNFLDIVSSGKAAVASALSSVDAYYNAIRTGTSEAVRAQLGDLETYKALIQEQLNVVKNARAQGAGSDVISQIAGGVGNIIGAFKDLDDAQAQLEKKLGDASGQMQGLSRALNDGSLAANDAKAAEEALAIARKGAINEQIGLVRTRADTDARLLKLQQSGTRAELDARFQELHERRNIVRQQLSALEGLPDKTDEVNAAIRTLQIELRELNYEDLNLLNTIAPIVIARQKEVDTLEASKKAIEESLKIREQLGDLETARSEQLADRARDDARARQVAALESKIAAAKEVEAEAERQDRIAKLRADELKGDADARKKLSASIGKVNSDFFASELKALRDFRLNEQRINDRAALERVRKLQDLEDDLTELAGSGDVLAFVKRQREGLKDIRRGDEDNSIEARTRLEDFQNQRQEAAAARADQIRDLLASFEEERRVRQQDAQTRIDQEIAAGKVQVKQSEALQQELTALREQFAQEDLIRRRQQEDRAFNDQKAALEKRQAELGGVIKKGADVLAKGATSFLEQVGGGIVSMINKIKAAAGGSSPKQTAAKNDVGGIYTTPTLGTLAETPGIGDVVIPFRKSEGFFPALQRAAQQSGGGSVGNGRGSIVVQINATVGDIATKSQLEAMESDLVSLFEQAEATLQSGNVALGSAS